MTFHRLFNIILLLALIPTIAVSGILTTTPFNGTVAATGFTGLEFNGATYDGQFVYVSFDDIQNSIPKVGGVQDITERFPFFGSNSLTLGFTNSVSSLLSANSAIRVSDGGSRFSESFLVPYQTVFDSRVGLLLADGSRSTIFGGTNSTPVGWAISSGGSVPGADSFYLIATESAAESSSAVPEPSSLVLILFCIATLAIGRKRFAEPAKNLAANA